MVPYISCFPLLNATSSNNNTPINYVDTKEDLFYHCRLSRSSSHCEVASMLGFLSAYVLPPVLLFGLLGNSFIIYVFSCKIPCQSRFNVYFVLLALIDNIYMMYWAFGWFFLARGLPYATNGQLGFFIFNVSSSVCSLSRYFNHCLSR